MNFKLKFHMGWAVVAVALALPALLPAAAIAHPALLQSSPSSGLIAPQAVRAVELSLSEPVIVDGSRISVRELGGAELPAGALAATDGDRTLTLRTRDDLGEGTYEVRWTTLGADGHAVSGRFAFGVAGPNGEAPDGAQAVIGFGERGGGVGDSDAATGIFGAVGKWLAVIAAAFLLGGLALLTRLRGALPKAGFARALERWRSLHPLALLLLVMASAEEVLANATAGAGDSLQLGLLFDSPTGVLVVIQLALSVALSVGALALGGRAETRDRLLGIGAGAVLAVQALSGHVQTLGDGIAFGALTQVLHVLAASLWMGGLLVLLLVTTGKGASAFARAARAFAPLAAASLAVAVVTGVIAALREVDDWYFLRWSSYGNVVLIKAVLVAVVIAVAYFVARRSGTRGGASGGRLAGAEAALVVVILALAVALTALVPGRGQALPALRDNLLPGAGLATAVADGGPVRITLAPSRAGQNVLGVLQEPTSDGAPPPTAGQVTAKLFCSCAKAPVRAELERAEAGDGWRADVDLPTDGPWYARVNLDERAASPVALPVGVPEAAGPGPLNVLAIGDLSGEGAARCRSHLIGLQLGIGRINALGGVDGGRKVAVLALDDGGSPERARELAEQAIDDQKPLALAAPCGPAAGEAVGVASRAGVPTVVADPAVPLVQGERVFRLAPDPYAEGYAQGQYVREAIAPTTRSRTVRAVAPTDATGQRRLEGLRASLDGSGLKIEIIPADSLERGPGPVRSLIDRRQAAAVMVDGDVNRIADSLGGLGDTSLDFAPAVLLTPASLLNERLLRASGSLGRTEAIQGAVEVAPDSRGAGAYAQAVPAIYPGEQPTLDGLRGYVAGLTLEQGLGGGTDPDTIASRLVQPPAFTDAILAPWRGDEPAAGGQRFSLMEASFLPPTLIPASAGGESNSGIFLTDGNWVRTTSEVLGPPLEQPVPALG